MVEIRYGERYEMADLAGRSIADAREQYKQEFGIPDKAQARLNDKGIGKKHEPKTALGDNDSLTFAEKSRKGLFFIGAILLALAITGGIFAYGATTVTVTLGLTAKTDFAEVEAATPTPWNVWGSYKGRVPAGDLFTITPEASVPADSWTGDMSVTLTIANAQDLVEAYKMLVFEIEVWDDGTAAIATGSTTEYLTLGKGDIDIDFEQGAPAGTYTVKIISGYYITHKGGWTDGKEDPLIMCQVLQREAP
ncbi:hypothetical protein ES703_53518 [subsurface metagenome]